MTMKNKHSNLIDLTSNFLAVRFIIRKGVVIMKHSVINLKAVKEITSCDRMFTDTVRSFCLISPVPLMQIGRVVAFMIDYIISDTKTRLLNFIGR